MRRAEYIRVATYAVVVGIAFVVFWPKTPSIDVHLVPSAYDLAVNSMLPATPRDSSGVGAFAPGFLPELEPVGGLPDGLRWERREGADFDVWFAGDTNGTSGVGIYFGMFPSFRGDDISQVEVGRVGTRPVVWCQTRDERGRVRFECRFAHRHEPTSGELLVHVWAYAENEAAVREFVRALGEVVFRGSSK